MHEQKNTPNTAAVTVGSEVDTVQGIDYSRINHLYKINTVTLNALCVWDFEEGEEGKCPGQDRSGSCNCKQKGEKIVPKIFLCESKD